jgi:hypothetical protein
MMTEGITNPAVFSERRAKIGQAALDSTYPRLKVVHDWRPDCGTYNRFSIEIPGTEAFHIQFQPMEVAEIGQTDKAWAAAMVQKVEDHLRSIKAD